jgi:hypothetical protein
MIAAIIPQLRKLIVEEADEEVSGKPPIFKPVPIGTGRPDRPGRPGFCPPLLSRIS